MSTLYRCDTCGKLLRHCAPHSREIAPPVVLRGVTGFHDEHTFCSQDCFKTWVMTSYAALANLAASPVFEARKASAITPEEYGASLVWNKP